MKNEKFTKLCGRNKWADMPAQNKARKTCENNNVNKEKNGR